MQTTVTLLFEQNPNPMVIYDPATIRIVDANAAAQQRYGYSHKEFTQLNLRDLFHPSDLHFLEKKLEQNPRVMRQTDTHRHLTKCGDIIHVQATSQPISDNGTQLRLVSLFDVSELVQTRTDFKQLFHKSNDLFLIVDPRSGHILDVNDRVLQHLDIDRQVIKKQHINDLLVSPGDEEPIDLTSLNAESDDTFQALLQKPDGGRLLLDIRVFSTSFRGEDALVLTGLDLTERYWAERALKQSEERLFEFMEHASILILLTGPEGNIIYANETWRKALGYDPSEIFELTLFDLVPPEYRNEIRKIADKLENDEIVDDFETVFITKTGRRLHLEGNASNRKMEGHPSFTSWFLKDVSQRRASEERVKQSLHEKEILLAEIHHRVKNNLALINSLLELQTIYLDDPKGLDALRESQSRVHSMALVHEQLYQNELVTQLDLHSYLTTLLHRLRQRFENNPDAPVLEIKLNAEHVCVNLNQAVTCGLLLNELLTNVFEFIYRQHKSGKLTLEVFEEDEEVVLSVLDEGVGVARAFLSNQKDSLDWLLIRTLIQQLEGRFEIKRLQGTYMSIRFIKDALKSDLCQVLA